MNARYIPEGKHLTDMCLCRYRSGSTVSLTATEWSYQSSFFVQPDGNILSDHNPVLVQFSWDI
jgi:hypothetical protein